MCRNSPVSDERFGILVPQADCEGATEIERENAQSVDLSDQPVTKIQHILVVLH